jgi:septal ring factor EnvC (AmiA/AmiB activator)
MTTTSHSIIDDNGMPIPGAQGVVGGANIGEIHSLYQDLFLTDIKREVENAQTELKACKQEQNNASREMTLLKRENQQLNATLKRYRK